MALVVIEVGGNIWATDIYLGKCTRRTCSTTTCGKTVESFPLHKAHMTAHSLVRNWLYLPRLLRLVPVWRCAYEPTSVQSKRLYSMIFIHSNALTCIASVSSNISNICLFSTGKHWLRHVRWNARNTLIRQKSIVCTQPNERITLICIFSRRQQHDHHIPHVRVVAVNFTVESRRHMRHAQCSCSKIISFALLQIMFAFIIILAISWSRTNERKNINTFRLNLYRSWFFLFFQMVVDSGAGVNAPTHHRAYFHLFFCFFDFCGSLNRLNCVHTIWRSASAAADHEPKNKHWKRSKFNYSLTQMVFLLCFKLPPQPVFIHGLGQTSEPDVASAWLY